MNKIPIKCTNVCNILVPRDCFAEELLKEYFNKYIVAPPYNYLYIAHKRLTSPSFCLYVIAALIVMSLMIFHPDLTSHKFVPPSFIL